MFRGTNKISVGVTLRSRATSSISLAASGKAEPSKEQAEFRGAFCSLANKHHEPC